MSSMYVLIGGVEFEGSDVLGVFDSAKAALAGREEYIASQEALPQFEGTLYDWYEVRQFEIGSVSSRGTLIREFITDRG